MRSQGWGTNPIDLVVLSKEEKKLDVVVHAYSPRYSGNSGRGNAWARSSRSSWPTQTIKKVKKKKEGREGRREEEKEGGRGRKRGGERAATRGHMYQRKVMVGGHLQVWKSTPARTRSYCHLISNFQLPKQ